MVFVYCFIISTIGYCKFYHNASLHLRGYSYKFLRIPINMNLLGVGTGGTGVGPGAIGEGATGRGTGTGAGIGTGAPLIFFASVPAMKNRKGIRKRAKPFMVGYDVVRFGAFLLTGAGGRSSNEEQFEKCVKVIIES